MIYVQVVVSTWRVRGKGGSNCGEGVKGRGSKRGECGECGEVDERGSEGGEGN